MMEVVRFLGEGSEGRVMLAKDTDGELVALKKLFWRPEINRLIEREIDILNSCRHKNVIHLKKALELSGEPCMIFEYMDFALSTLTRRLRLTPVEIKLVMQQALEGLAHCHAKHVLHLDIKPANILVNDSGVVKVADFGVSSKISADLPDPHYVGTPEYTAPELLMGSTNYGPAVDIWSLGCVFAEMLNGKGLFAGCDCEFNTSECNCNVERRVFQHIVEVCGTPNEDNWPGFTKLPDFERMMEEPASSSERMLRKMFEHVDPFAVDLLDRMLVFNPAERITAQEALESEYFTGPKQSQVVQCFHRASIAKLLKLVHCHPRVILAFVLIADVMLLMRLWACS